MQRSAPRGPHPSRTVKSAAPEGCRRSAPRVKVEAELGRHYLKAAAFGFEEAEWESDLAADVAQMEHVADGGREDFGDAEAEEHLRGDKGAIT